MELAIFAYGLSQIPQLKSLKLKVIQKFLISMDHIEKFVEKVSSMMNIKKFDLYFRKQIISEGERPDIERRFSRFNRVKFCCCPQSLYLYKTDSF